MREDVDELYEQHAQYFWISVHVMDRHDSSENVDSRPINWKREAQAVADDIRSCVTSVFLIESLSSSSDLSSSDGAYLNIEILEHRRITVKVDSRGFTIVGNNFNDASFESGEVTGSSEWKTFETPYALLHSISPLYSSSFGGQLHKKLTDLVGRNKAS